MFVLKISGIQNTLRCSKFAITMQYPNNKAKLKGKREREIVTNTPKGSFQVKTHSLKFPPCVVYIIYVL